MHQNIRGDLTAVGDWSVSYGRQGLVDHGGSFS